MNVRARDSVSAEPVGVGELRPRRKRGRTAVATAALFVAAGGAFAAGQIEALGAADGGSKTPEGAVDAMFESLSQNDVLGVLDHLAPGEREVVKDATVDYVGELSRLGVLSDDLDLSAVPCFEFSYSGMTYEAEQANERVWLVEVTGGTVIVGVNTAELPVGNLLFDRLDLETNSVDETVTVDIAEEIGDEELRVAVVEDDGSYYVSSFYTAAELAAAGAGYTMPATPIPAVGAATPEDALRGVIDAGVQLDVAGLIELTPPDEMAALHDYGPILVELADEALVETDVQTVLDGWTFSVDALDLEQVEVTGGIKLLPTHIAVSGSDTEGRSFEASATKVDETCVDYSVTAVDVVEAGPDEVSMSGQACAADIAEAFEGSDVPIEVQQIAERMVGQLGQLGAVTVEVDGLWYVSPSRSVADVLLVAMQGLDNADLETLVDFVSSSLSDLDGEWAEYPSEIVIDEVTPPTTAG